MEVTSAFSLELLAKEVHNAFPKFMQKRRSQQASRDDGNYH
jgi:hypothetical protein